MPWPGLPRLRRRRDEEELGVVVPSTAYFGVKNDPAQSTDRQ